MALILALDIGTSSARALLFDDAGRALAPPSQLPYANGTTPGGGVETDADALLELAARCVDAALAGANQPIAGVALATFWHSLLCVGPDDNARSPLFSWADNRAGAWVAALRGLLDEGAAHERTGCPFHASYWPAKLLWLHETRPELFTQTRWMSWGEYLALKWTGTARASLSMASGTGLFNQNARDWDDATLQVLPVSRASVSPLCDAGDALGPLRPELAARWPALRGVPWYPALGDGACSNLGSGATGAGQFALNAGTSGALRSVTHDDAPAPPGLWRYRADAARGVVGGSISNVGNVLLWLSHTLQLREDWHDAVMQMEPGSHGLNVLPFLAGERAPLWNPAARFVLSGASLDTSPLQILRASLEAVALRFAAVHARLEAGAGDEIIGSGGAFEAAPGWAQIVCDALGVPLSQSREAEATARGAALRAWESLGLRRVEEFGWERGETLQPDARRHAVYQRALDAQNAFYGQMWPGEN